MGRRAPGGVPVSHPTRGAATRGPDGSELLRPRLSARPRSGRVGGGGGGGRVGGQRRRPAPTPTPVPPGRSAGGGGRSLGRMAGRFLKIWG